MGLRTVINPFGSFSGGSKYINFVTTTATTYNKTAVAASTLNQVFYDGDLLPSTAYTAVISGSSISITFTIKVDSGVNVQLVYS